MRFVKYNFGQKDNKCIHAGITWPTLAICTSFFTAVCFILACSLETLNCISLSCLCQEKNKTNQSILLDIQCKKLASKSVPIGQF